MIRAALYLFRDSIAFMAAMYSVWGLLLAYREVFA